MYLQEWILFVRPLCQPFHNSHTHFARRISGCTPKADTSQLASAALHPGLLEKVRLFSGFVSASKVQAITE
jgi:hypothetical protein